ncbi:uncharacterized protein LOC121280123 isoform X2 [Carcharodon carcharias]|uniref:uncharacterized protein LOC121280123 isoform X2 n=1 Tax=Carcharodon carcharias TaxID=13397 RepID=UPI001B7E52DA|nr:uncharacterized protein LOC121280123 isoform X2 [Carcharodon carcharias]
MESRLRVPQNRNLPAAVTQCFSVVALCTAVADPNWFQVSLNGTSPQIYGVAYVVHLQGNLTAAATIQQNEGYSITFLMWLVGDGKTLENQEIQILSSTMKEFLF